MGNRNSYIEDAKTCAQQLKNEGLADWGNRIIDAIKAGSTGGEIAMAVRWNLQELLKSGQNVSEETHQLAQKISKDISATGW